MKIQSVSLNLALAIGATAFLAICSAQQAFSQEPVKKEAHKKIMLKVVSDDNGKTTVIDTTFEMPDSAMDDSIRQEVDRVIELSKAGRHGRIKIRTMPDGYDYKFDLPCIPDLPMNMGDFREFDIEIPDMEGMSDFDGAIWEPASPRPDRRMMRFDGESRSLNDILGDIPMDRVKSYTIKDRKKGKRITIDIDDAPTFDQHNRVVVIREPGRTHRHKNKQNKQVKVYVTPDGNDAKTIRVETELNTPPPPPPPPAPDKK